MGVRLTRRQTGLRQWLEDGGVCWICGGWILWELPDNHPDRMSRDHVIPKRWGGTRQRINMRAAHKRCNEDRGDRMPDVLDPGLAALAARWNVSRRRRERMTAG